MIHGGCLQRACRLFCWKETLHLCAPPHVMYKFRYYDDNITRFKQVLDEQALMVNPEVEKILIQVWCGQVSTVLRERFDDGSAAA